MKQLRKPPPDSPSWNQHEWVALDATIARIKDSGVGSFDLACRDLYEHLLAGRMESGVRFVASNCSGEARSILQPEFWRGLEIVRSVLPHHPPGHALVRATREGQPFAGGSWYFFVRTADLDKHYAGVRVDPEEETPARRKPGPKPRANWQLEVARYLIHRCREDKNYEIPSAATLAQWCDNTLGYQPDVRELQRLIRFLLG